MKVKHVQVETVQEKYMQDGELDANRDGQSIPVATGKYDEHGSSSGSYKNQRMKKGMTILNKPECLSRPLGAECGNTAKENSGGVGGGRRQR